MSLPEKPCFLTDHFISKEFCKQFNIYLPVRSQRPKTTVICEKEAIGTSPNVKP